MQKNILIHSYNISPTLIFIYFKPQGQVFLFIYKTIASTSFQKLWSYSIGLWMVPVDEGW